MQDELKKYTELNKKIAAAIEKRQKHLAVQAAKIIELKEENNNINEFFKTWKQKQNEYATLVKSVKENEEVIKQQQDKLKKAQIVITENKKLIEQRIKEDEEIQITLASDNHELEQQLNEVYEIKKNMVPHIYNFDFDFDKLINPTPANSAPNSPTLTNYKVIQSMAQPLTIDTTIANSAFDKLQSNSINEVKPIINNSTPNNSVPNSPALDKLQSNSIKVVKSSTTATTNSVPNSPAVVKSTNSTPVNSAPNSPAVINKHLQVDKHNTRSVTA
ncbi:hypothetical protein ACJMK2_015133, partial [Sinanodonta woodiana]